MKKTVKNRMLSDATMKSRVNAAHEKCSQIWSMMAMRFLSVTKSWIKGWRLAATLVITDVLYAKMSTIMGKR